MVTPLVKVVGLVRQVGDLQVRMLTSDGDLVLGRVEAPAGTPQRISQTGESNLS